MTDKEKRLAALETEIASRLSSGRMAHVRGVRDTALRMASLLLTQKELAAGDPSLGEQIAAAALLHDVAKEESFEKQLQLAEQFGIMMSAEDASRYAVVLHAMAAASLIPSDFSAYDTEKVKHAVAWHTTGTPDMDMLSAIIFIADYIEDGRAYPACIAARRFFFDGSDQRSREEMARHLDRTVVYVLEETVDYLTKTGRAIYPTTFDTLDFYRQKLKTV